MPVPLRYNLRSLFYRKTATLLTVIAVGLTIAVVAVNLSVAIGFINSVATSGDARNVIVMRNGSLSEGESTITRDEANKVKGFAGIGSGADGRPLVTGEMYAGIALPRVGGPKHGTTNVPLRGTSLEALAIRDHVRIKEGRMFRLGTREIVVGKALIGSIEGCHLGGTVRITKDEWSVVGILDGGGTAFDTEIWGDIELLLQAFDRPFYNTVVFRKQDGADIASIPRLVGEVKVKDERTYFEEQSGTLGGAMIGGAVVLSILMSLGALAGCTNTLLAAVAGRTREIGGLLAIGYRPIHIFLGFLAEALVITLMGAVLGIGGALLFNGTKAGTTNWATFTEQAFTFRVDGFVIGAAVAFALLIGLIGGSLPAWRASRLKPVTALRRG